MFSTGDFNVVFGTGPLGYSVAEELILKGKNVKLVNRSGKGDIPEEAVLVKADAVDSEKTREVCRGAAVVYHCAMPPYTHWPELFPPLTYGIVEGTASAGAKLVYADNLYMYGYTDSPINEKLPNNPLGPKGKIRAEMSEKLLKYDKEGKLRVAVGRASDFYGPRVISSILGERVFKPALRGKAINLIGNIDVPHTFTYIKDFAKGLVTLGDRGEALGEVWHIPSAQTVTTREILHLVFNQTKNTPRVKTAPKYFLHSMSWFNPTIKELREALPFFEKPYIVDHSKFARLFGNHSTPHIEAIRETVDWYVKKYRF